MVGAGTRRPTCRRCRRPDQLGRSTSPTTGNTASANGAAITLDTTAPSAPSLSLATDSGSSNSDQITNNGTVHVGGLESGATWQYSTDDGGELVGRQRPTFTLAGTAR